MNKLLVSDINQMDEVKEKALQIKDQFVTQIVAIRDKIKVVYDNLKLSYKKTYYEIEDVNIEGIMDERKLVEIFESAEKQRCDSDLLSLVKDHYSDFVLKYIKSVADSSEEYDMRELLDYLMKIIDSMKTMKNDNINSTESDFEYKKK